KVSRADRLIAAFDALIISKSSRIRVDVAKIIYGDKQSTLSVKTDKLFRDVGKVIEKVRDLLSGSSPPKLILNDHCPECEYRDRCRRNAIAKNDLSLLTNLGFPLPEQSKPFTMPADQSIGPHDCQRIPPIKEPGQSRECKTNRIGRQPWLLFSGST